MDAGYSVETTVKFRLTFDDREFNNLLLPNVQKAFAEYVKEVDGMWVEIHRAIDSVMSHRS